MGDVKYRSEVQIRLEKIPLRYARLPGKEEEVTLSAHDELVKIYGVEDLDIPEAPATIDYLVTGVAG